MGLIKPGKKAPHFALIDQHSQLIELERLLETGPVVLVFYKQDFSPESTAQLLRWKEAAPEMKAQHIGLVALNAGEWEGHHQFDTQHGFPFPLVYDHLGRTAKKYGAIYFPVLWMREATFLISPGGFIQAHWPDRPLPETVLEKSTSVDSP